VNARSRRPEQGCRVPQCHLRLHDRVDRPTGRLHQQIPRRRLHGDLRRAA
jgi:hypothetical protein